MPRQRERSKLAVCYRWRDYWLNRKPGLERHGSKGWAVRSHSQLDQSQEAGLLRRPPAKMWLQMPTEAQRAGLCHSKDQSWWNLAGLKGKL